VTDWVEIDNAVRTRGYAHFKLNESKNKRLLELMGRVVQTTAVRLLPQASTYLSSPQALAAHTDHPWVDLILWKCVVQDQHDGTQVLLDGHAICAELGSEIDALRSIRLPVPGLHDLKPSGAHPILGDDGLYWVPWRNPPQLSKAEAIAYKKFKRLTAENFDCTGIRLQPGEMLLIDNRRMLHGRGALPSNSSRLLRRWWIKRN
jgi:hypothetical protein